MEHGFRSICWWILCITHYACTCWWVVIACMGSFLCNITHYGGYIIKFPVSQISRPWSYRAHFNISWKHCHHTRHWRPWRWGCLCAQKRYSYHAFYFFLIEFWQCGVHKINFTVVFMQVPSLRRICVIRLQNILVSQIVTMSRLSKEYTKEVVDVSSPVQLFQRVLTVQNIVQTCWKWVF